MKLDLEHRIARLRQGDHLCLIYQSAAEQIAALIPYFKAGLAASERCLFVGHGTSARRLERCLDEAGVDVQAECERGALVFLTQRESWLPRGRFDPGSMMDLLRQAEQQALDDGFSGLRATWNMGWVLEGTAAGGERLIEYEAHLNRFLAGSRTCALCRYSREGSPSEALQQALHTHPIALLGDQVCANAFYEPPDLVLGDRSPDERIDWMLAQLQRARFSEARLEEVTLRLSQKRAALERADRAKTELLSMLAHELRNPLGTISNALEVLRLKQGAGDEAAKRAIGTAERQVHHQAQLIDDLLEASRVTRGEVELRLEEVDLVELVRVAVEGYGDTLVRRGGDRARPRHRRRGAADGPRGPAPPRAGALEPARQRRQVHPRGGRITVRGHAARRAAGEPSSPSATPAPASRPRSSPTSSRSSPRETTASTARRGGWGSASR